MAWFETWFDTPYYHILYKDRDFLEAENFIRLLSKDLQLPVGASIIDLACGKGRHSLYLSKLGYKVYGLDLSSSNIQHNMQWASESLRFMVHDMRKPMFPDIVPEQVDAVFNLFTSFGYFDEASEDRRVFSSVTDALKPGGIFVLDFLNQQYVRKTIVPSENISKEGIDFQINKTIDNDHVVKDIRFSDKGVDFHFFERVKLHSLDEITNYAVEAGLERLKIFGDYSLKPFDEETSPRCISVFRKI